ncbi:hypothetical protein GCM10007350_11250 [Jeongeupia chitinilytica]|uniref:Lipoprotein n=1 Tax=Jeongeupia chitinilytica TaxID=1041641 RepID=A0ABQ3GXE4_9NEIS|nr:hypothetical protein GCM10007350_11250 [Jeongeupia chitinilytica]
MRMLSCALLLVLTGCAIAMTSEVQNPNGHDARRGFAMSNGCVRAAGASGPIASACTRNLHP